MADLEVEHLLIGGGVAAAACAAQLRAGGGQGSILLATREQDAPYHRPPCSKDFLLGRASREDLLVHPADWWERQEVELRTRSAVMSLDLEARTARLASKQEVRFATALLATGAMVRRVNVEGSDLEGVHYLRAPGNADAIRADAEPAEDVVLIGGSFIGCEVAASLTTMGKRCTIVMQESVTLERGFGPTAGGFAQGLLADHGVTVIGEDDLERFEGSVGRVETVVTKAGHRLPAQLVVMGTGASPDVMLARRAGLELGERGGVRASASLASSAAGVYVAGDMCEFDSPLHGGVVRIEHEDVAMAQGRTAARAMLGETVEHTELPYFWSHLADWTTLEYVSAGAAWDEEVLRGSVDDGTFSVWFLRDGRAQAALSVGRPEDLEAARPLVAAHADLRAQRDALADPGTDPSALGA
ncbi:MAG TPA: FAD-dependent oxidoreductase [Solirubrobacteraceae bacterium]|nr:FAD-dependent oxidoreductase [Solirubrobacteraceae bacterium]